MTPPLVSHSYKISRKICFIHFWSMSIGSYCRTLQNTLCLTEWHLRRLHLLNLTWNKYIYSIICISTLLLTMWLIMHYRAHVFTIVNDIYAILSEVVDVQNTPAGRVTCVPGVAQLRAGQSIWDKTPMETQSNKGPWKAGPHTDYQLNSTFLQCKWCFARRGKS